MKIANRVDAAQIDWKKMKYMVYDVPNHKGTYETRYALLRSCPPLTYQSLKYFF